LEEITNIKQAIKSNALSLFFISKANKEVALLIIETLISETVLFFNVGKNMNEYQIKETANLLLNDPIAKNMKPEDYRVMFNNAKSFKYGKQYDRIDGAIIFEWLETYWNERTSILEKFNLEKHRILIEQEKKEIVGVSKILEVYKEAKNIAIENEGIKPNQKFERSDKDKLVMGYFEEFRKARNGIDIKGKKFIQMQVEVDVEKGENYFELRKVDEIEYAEERLKQHYKHLK